MAHKVVDEGCGRRTAEIKVLGRYDNVEALPRVQKLAALLQFLGGVEEGSPADADSGLSLVAKKNEVASGKEPRYVRGQAWPRDVWIVSHSPLF